MIGIGARRWRRVPYSAILTGPTPDLIINFATGRGIPVANGGAGGRGSDTVTITSPQSGAGFYRRRREAYDPTWQGYPLFELKPANQLVGWAGPRAGGWWVGPMPSRSSTTETVAVYNSQTGLTVSNVAGGVIGPDAIRCDVAAGQNGDGWSASPAPLMTNWWIVDGAGNRTACYLHAVVELLGNIADHRFVFGLYDVGAANFIEQLSQRYDTADGPRSGKIYRGIGPHGGHLYEIWALARLISTPVGPLSALAYLLSSGSGSNPARSVIVHGIQLYFIEQWQLPWYGLPPFFSYARGLSVAWTMERLDIAHTAEEMTVAFWIDNSKWLDNFVGRYVRITNRHSNIAERHNKDYQFDLRNTLGTWAPTSIMTGYNGRGVVRTDASRNRSMLLPGGTIQSHGQFSETWTPNQIGVGYSWDTTLYAQVHKLHVWFRALTDAEMIAAARAL